MEMGGCGGEGDKKDGMVVGNQFFAVLPMLWLPVQGLD